MKKLIALATVLAATSAGAQELKFGDVNYFLKQSQLNVSADINQTYNRFYDKANTAFTDRGYLVQTNFAYALSDAFNVTLGLDYMFQNKLKSDNLSSVESNGLANPALGANVRLLNQSTNEFNFDLGVVARLQLEQSQAANIASNRDGNFVNNRHGVEVNARLGRKWNEANEFQFAAGLNYYLDSDTAQIATDRDVNTDSSYDIFARATYQYRPVNEFMMLLSLQGTRVGSTDGKLKASNASYETDDHIDFDFNFVAKYLIKENFIAKFKYGQSRNANYDTKVGGTSDEIRKRRENTFGLGVDFLF